VPPDRRRFLVRLLLVHGTLSNYRLARLIKYSFFKNILFCAMLFLFQVMACTMRGCVRPAVRL
jgi:magnesium-transporting ATPase (P-type)